MTILPFSSVSRRSSGLLVFAALCVGACDSLPGAIEPNPLVKGSEARLVIMNASTTNMIQTRLRLCAGGFVNGYVEDNNSAVTPGNSYTYDLPPGCYDIRASFRTPATVSWTKTATLAKGTTTFDAKP